MASRYADPSRFDRERDRDRDRNRDRDRDRRRTPPRRGREKSPVRRDRSRDRYSGRYSDARIRDDRDRRDRDADRRDDRREPVRRRSRSRSPPRRGPSRDRHGDRFRHGHNDRHYDDRDRRRRSNSRPRGSASATPAADSRRGRSDAAPHQEPQKEAKAKGKEKMEERLAKWKEQHAPRLTNPDAATPTSIPSPAIPAPVVAQSPPSSEPVRVELPAKTEFQQKKTKTEKSKQKQPEKSNFKLDESAASRPMLAHAGDNAASTPKPKFAQSLEAKRSFAFTELEDETSQNPLDNEGAPKKRKLQALPEFTASDAPEVPVGDEEDDSNMSDMGSDDEETTAKYQARLEERRAKLEAQEKGDDDTTMDEASAIAPAGDQMDVDEKAEDDDEVDPLDAFMANLSDTPRNAPSGATMFTQDFEPDQTSVEDADLLALRATKKKRKEMPVVDHSKIEYAPFRKNFYVEPAEITAMTVEEVAALRFELDGIKVKPDNVARPVQKWAQMGLLSATLNKLTAKGFVKPTSIQAQAIPIAESGRDLIGIAKTGSGKTLAFGIPMIRHILDQPPLKPADGPIALILAPTRELANQITNELKPFLDASNLTIKAAFGGHPISDDIAMLKRGGVHVLCATTGRLIDLLQSNSGRVLNFRRVTYVVLDEADRMFDMGFEPQVMKIIASVRPDRQTILFSATMPKIMASLGRKALVDPVEVIIGGRSRVASEITQVIKFVPPSYEEKIKALLRQLGQIFAKDEKDQILIFVQRQETAEDLLSKLFKAKYTTADTIHGAKDQSDRNEAIDDFKKGVLSILIATSVASRGLDVPGLANILNFDSPEHLEDYVHRCGRTGRAGKQGTAITFIEQPGQERSAFNIARALKESGTEIPAELQQMADVFSQKVQDGTEKYYSGFGGKGLDKLDATRALEKKREKRAHKLEGEEDSEDEAEVPALKAPEVSGPAASPVTASVPDNEAEPGYMKLLSNQIVVHKTERSEAASSGAPMTARQRAEMAAKKLDGRLSKKGMIHAGQPIDNKGPDAGLYHSTLEINDFPQKARWSVTNRSNVAKILDQTGVSITTKGHYYPPGVQPLEGEQTKLYILVEGDNENVVTQAMTELTRLLREGTIAAEEAPQPRLATGKYKVV